MPQIWPDDIVAYRCEFYLQHNTTVFLSPITKKRQVLRRPGERWTCTASFRLQRPLAQRLDALLAKLKGASDTVSVWDFARPTSLGVNTEAPPISDTRFADTGSPSTTTFTDGSVFGGGAPQIAVWGTHLPGAAAIAISGWYPSVTVLKAGDYIQIDDWLYMLTDDLVASSAGIGTASIAPAVREIIAHGTSVTRTRARTEMQLVDDGQPNRGLETGGLYQYTISLIEAL